ncbi:CAP domain-containing protein [Lentilactobacillus sp. Marseille-Q4993]|uniref:CAP domain-containing protein n=1 Tax=Lentilactobacillus sp. Marseille-Q4993 TaxID=3039492 RepID=UPI0024BD4D51|nr:CAP domain-containing protein [Lentilactobacillus sp. Marseille-Q4993]
MKLNKVILFSTLGLALGSGLMMPQQASAKRKPSVLRVVSSEAHAKQYRVAKGTIYKNYNLTKVKAKASKYKKTVFYSSETITVRRPNGKKAVYRTLANRYGKEFGFIWHGYAKKIKTLSWNFGDFDAPTKKSDKDNKETNFYNSSELQQVNELRSKATAIYNSTKGMYQEKPSLSGSFNPGKLNDSYIQGTVDWINYYRSFYGLSPVSSNSGWNTEAQYGAATLAAVDNGLSHGLVGFSKPSYISQSDWQHGAEATNTSNLATGVISPEDNITLYINDSGNDVPGHREWLLGGITQVGVGQANNYNDLKVFDPTGDGTDASEIKFPNAGLFPFEASSDTRWSLSLPQRLSTSAQPTITIHDNTANKDVSVSNVIISNSGYGEFGTSISYEPDSDSIKENHSYTINISNLPNGMADVSYSTKLFPIHKAD